MDSVILNDHMEAYAILAMKKAGIDPLSFGIGVRDKFSVKYFSKPAACASHSKYEAQD
jgi:hypothetical protein